METTAGTGCRCDTLAAELIALRADLAALSPVTPVYGLPEAAVLLPCTPSTLRALLKRQRHRLEPPRYRLDAGHRRHRMLSTHDMQVLRSCLLRPSRRTRLQALAQMRQPAAA